MVRSPRIELGTPAWKAGVLPLNYDRSSADGDVFDGGRDRQASFGGLRDAAGGNPGQTRSEEHTSELQSLRHLVCRLLLEKKKTTDKNDGSKQSRAPPTTYTRTDHET